MWFGGVDAVPRVKADFAARRARADRVLGLDVLDLRHRIPAGGTWGRTPGCSPLAYRLMAREGRGGSTGITADDWFVTDEVDETVTTHQEEND